MANTLKFVGTGLAKKYQTMARQMPTLIREAMLDVAGEAKTDFEKTVETWKNKPKFRIDERSRSYTVATDDEVYHFVDKGTKPHPIDPVNASMLAFRGGYQAKTTPRVIASRSGGASGPVIYTSHVDHPGTKARNFSKLIHEKWQKKVAGYVRERLKQGIEAIGL
jgi:hypothetical protein